MGVRRAHGHIIPVHAARRHALVAPVLRRRFAERDGFRDDDTFLLLHPHARPCSARRGRKVARHRRCRCFSALLHEHLGLLLAVKERGGFFQGSALCFDDVGDDEHQFDDEPAAVDEVLRFGRSTVRMYV